MNIPVYQPDLTGNERKYVLDCMDTGWISSRGTYIERFEAACRDYIKVPHAMSCTNGTVALHLALLALDIGPGDEVIMPSLTYVATANAARFVGADPVFVDSLPETWQMDPADVRRKITPRTKAVMAVHLYGLPCDLEALAEICTEHGLLLIEDAAEAWGSRIGGRHVGLWGDVATFSFFGNKTITTGEGGLVVCRDARIADRIAKLKNQYASDTRRYWHDDVGYNFRMTNLCAAIGLAQMERVDQIIASKRALAAKYKSRLADLPVEFHNEPQGYHHTYWMCSILCETMQQRDALRNKLDERGVETRPFFFPAHTMPMFSYLEANSQDFPVADSLSGRGVNLPSYPAMTDEQIDYVVGVIDSALR